jgi:hypothetical protein
MHLYQHINVVDDRLGDQFHRYAQREHWRGPAAYIRVNSQWSMDQIARRILQNAPRGLGVVRLCSHGNSGHVELGQGLTAANAWRFQLLSGHWQGRFPKIEVHACGVLSATPVACPASPRPGTCTPGTVALDGPGHAIMQALSNAAGVLVTAAYHVQWSDRDFRYEGQVGHFRPARS